ncbi:MAG: hypothetical protein AB7L26_11825 [Hyphomonadaceae bacterium]
MFALVALLLLASPAHAQRGASLVTGHWTFETQAESSRGCVVRGNAVLQPQANVRGRFDVMLETQETCRNGDTWRSTQRCLATESGRNVRIACTILSAQPSNYAADNFNLEIRGADLMTGSLLSTWNAPATWRRAAPAYVS